MSSKDELLSELLENFLFETYEIEAIIVSDYDGLIISGVKKEKVDMEIVSILSAIVNPILERIRNEFAFKRFGTAAFDTEDYRILFVSVSDKATLSIVMDAMGSIEKIAPFAYLLAEKTAQVLTADVNESVQISLPIFEFLEAPSERIMEQIYELKLDTGGIYKFKFIIIGDHEVGKTSLIRRYVENTFSEDYRTTIGLNILTHAFEFFGNEIRLTLWDVGAQKYFKRYRKTYYVGAQAAFIVFDLSRRETYDNLKNWLKELDDFIPNKDIPIVLIGNKSDLVDQRVVKYQEGAKMANELAKTGISRISYIETSALNGENVNDAFRLITYHYIMEIKDDEEFELSKKLFAEIKSILENNKKLELTFISESTYWSPGLQIIAEISQLGKYKKIKDEKEEKIYEYENGLVLKNLLYNNIKIPNSDAVFCIFDARGKSHIDSEWLDIVIQILENLKEKGIIFIGMRVLEDLDWPRFIDEFNIDEKLEKKADSLIFFKIGDEYREDIYGKLLQMLKLLDKMIWMSRVS